MVSPRFALRFGLLSLLAAAAGCEAGRPTVVVRAKTDLAPGREFFSVEVALLREPAADPRRATTPATTADDFLGGVRVAEFDGVTPGVRTLRVTLRDADGAAVIARDVRVGVEATISVTVLLPRVCRDVVCPGAGDPADATECYAGRCVPPECTEEDREPCGPSMCEALGDCAALGSSCVRSACEDGRCLYSLDDGECAPPGRCDFALGCVGAPADAGSDAAMIDSAAPDAGVDSGGDSGADTGSCADGCFQAGCQPGNTAAACGITGGVCASCSAAETCGGGGAPGVCGSPACRGGTGTCADPERICPGTTSLTRDTCGVDSASTCATNGDDYVFFFCDPLFFTTLTAGFVVELRSADGSASCGGTTLSCGLAGAGHDRSCSDMDHGTYAIVERRTGGCGTFTLEMIPL